MSDGDEPLILDAVLYPQRSLPPAGFAALMAVIAGLSFLIGAGFWWAGAWPVIGFLGLDVALIYLAFRLNYRTARRYETIRLSRDALEITRCDPWGRIRRTVLRPGWLRVLVQGSPPDACRLLVTDRGGGVELGAFLAPDEKRDFADALRRALEIARSGGPAPAGASPPLAGG